MEGERCLGVSTSARRVIPHPPIKLDLYRRPPDSVDDKSDHRDNLRGFRFRLLDAPMSERVSDGGLDACAISVTPRGSLRPSVIRLPSTAPKARMVPWRPPYRLAHMRRGGAVSGVVALVGAVLFLCVGPATAAPRHDCGNPPDWSGHLIAFGVGCGQARAVFEGIHCSDSGCTEIHSGAWQCYRRTISRLEGRGNCSLGSRRIRWVVYE